MEFARIKKNTKSVNQIPTLLQDADFSQFVRGNEELNRRIFEYIFLPRAPDNFVFSPTLFSIPITFIGHKTNCRIFKKNSRSSPNTVSSNTILSIILTLYQLPLIARFHITRFFLSPLNSVRRGPTVLKLYFGTYFTMSRF